MKHHAFPLSILAPALAAATLASLPAHAAAPSKDLLVKGKIGIPACEVTTANDGIYDFGTISSSLIKAGAAFTPLNSITHTWTASCDALTTLSFSITDNRAGSAAVSSNTTFGLGNVNGTGKLGYYTVTMQNATVDGQTSLVYSTIGTSFNAFPTVKLADKLIHGWAKANNAQAIGKLFTAALEVTPTLAGSATMNGPITNEVPLDGSLTLNFAFGL